MESKLDTGSKPSKSSAWLSSSRSRVKKHLRLDSGLLREWKKHLFTRRIYWLSSTKYYYSTRGRSSPKKSVVACCTKEEEGRCGVRDSDAPSLVTTAPREKTKASDKWSPPYKKHDLDGCYCYTHIVLKRGRLLSKNPSLEGKCKEAKKHLISSLLSRHFSQGLLTL